jgi:bacteriocin leader peptide (microcyclamide/patellamide family)
MNKQKLIPQVAQPVNRIMAGQLPAELAELSEEILQLHSDDGASVLSSLASADSPPDCASCGACCNLCYCGSCCIRCGGRRCGGGCECSYDGDDAE